MKRQPVSRLLYCVAGQPELESTLSRIERVECSACYRKIGYSAPALDRLLGDWLLK